MKKKNEIVFKYTEQEKAIIDEFVLRFGDDSFGGGKKALAQFINGKMYQTKQNLLEFLHTIMNMIQTRVADEAKSTQDKRASSLLGHAYDILRGEIATNLNEPLQTFIEIRNEKA
jgi:hypothetical protein